MSLDQPPQDKMMTAPPAKKEFHFAGGGIWHNLTIHAEHIEDATKQWLSSRKLINPPVEQSTVAPEPAPEENTLQ
jgi:hypothetical protein